MPYFLKLILSSMLFLGIYSCSIEPRIHYKSKELVTAEGYIEADALMLKQYQLVYSHNGKLIKHQSWSLDDCRRSFLGSNANEIKFSTHNACRSYQKNIWLKLEPDVITVEVYLEEISSGWRIKIGEVVVDKFSERIAVILSQVYVGNDKTNLIPRLASSRKFDWQLAQSVYSQHFKDTLYYYTTVLRQSSNRLGAPYVELQ